MHWQSFTSQIRNKIHQPRPGWKTCSVNFNFLYIQVGKLTPPSPITAWMITPPQYCWMIIPPSSGVWKTICDALPHSSYQNFWSKIPWVPPTSSISGILSGVPPPPENENLVRTWHLGFELVCSIPPPPKMEILSGLGTLELSWSRVPHPQGLMWELVCGG